MVALNDVIDWIAKERLTFINARRVAKAFNVNTKVAGHLLRKLRKLGYLKVYTKRRGRFIVYKIIRPRTARRPSKLATVH